MQAGRQSRSGGIILPAIPRATVVNNADGRSPLPKAMNRATKGVTVHAQALARATGIGAANGCCTRSEDPALLTELAQKPSSAPAPLAESLRDLNASLLLFPDAVPGVPDKDHASRAVMVFASSPALSRLRCGTRTASTLAAGLCAGSPR